MQTAQTSQSPVVTASGRAVEGRPQGLKAGDIGIEGDRISTLCFNTGALQYRSANKNPLIHGPPHDIVRSPLSARFTGWPFLPRRFARFPGCSRPKPYAGLAIVQEFHAHGGKASMHFITR